MGMSRFISVQVVFLLVACSMGLGQAFTQTGSTLPRSFHDDGLNMTFFFPAHFKTEPVPPASGRASCVRTVMSARSALASGASTFALSTIDNSCPDTLRAALTLGAFTRQQVLDQLKPSGKLAIIHEPARYAIDGHPAAITLASASLATDDEKVSQVYAAKACAVESVARPAHKKSEAAEPGSEVFCVDFTTQNRDQFSLMLSFIVQFGDDAPEPLFLSSVYPSRWSESGIGRR